MPAPKAAPPAISHTERMDAVRQLAYAVEDVHAAGVTHNDIKADNCLRSADGDFKLADLGRRPRTSQGRQQGDGWEHLLAHDF